MEKFRNVDRRAEIKPNELYENPEKSWGWSYNYPEIQQPPNQAIELEIVRTLNSQSSNCFEAYFDMLHWASIVLGDFYGNRGIHTSVYYLWALLFLKLPQWVQLCSDILIVSLPHF